LKLKERVRNLLFWEREKNEFQHFQQLDFNKNIIQTQIKTKSSQHFRLKIQFKVQHMFSFITRSLI
jgi:hypothetical protein